MRMLKGQSVVEYSIGIAILLIAIVVMQAYVRRGLQGRYADVADLATSQAGGLKQYEPDDEEQKFDVTQSVEGNEELVGKGVIKRTITKNTATRKGTDTEIIK